MGSRRRRPRLTRRSRARDGGRDERVLEIEDQVVARLDPNRQAYEIARRSERRVCGRCVRHARRHLDQALDAAERLRELEELRAGDERNSLPVSYTHLTLPTN